MDVGVRELKENLSEYLDRASRGELIRVTDRGHPKALLAPIPGQAQLERGLREKWLRAGKVTASARVKRHRSGMSVVQSLANDRDA